MHKIKVAHLSKKFKDVEVLRDINLECQSGRIYGLIGYNGSGKTVLFKCICGFLKANQGFVEVDGQRIGKEKDMLTEAGIIIENPGFLRKKTAYQNLEYLYTLRNKMNREHILQVLDMVGLDGTSKKKVGKYSLGMKQRLAIAQAIMESPDILILDEPMNGLDKNGIKEMRELFLEMKQQDKIILLASHNKDDIAVLCDEVYEIQDGMLERVNVTQ